MWFVSSFQTSGHTFFPKLTSRWSHHPVHPFPSCCAAAIDQLVSSLWPDWCPSVWYWHRRTPSCCYLPYVLRLACSSINPDAVSSGSFRHQLQARSSELHGLARNLRFGEAARPPGAKQRTIITEELHTQTETRGCSPLGYHTHAPLKTCVIASTGISHTSFM